MQRPAFISFFSRSLRLRVLLVTGLSLILVMSFGGWQGYGYIKSGFDFYETREISAKIELAELAISNELKGLHRQVLDYAIWNETVDMMQGITEKEYLQSNFVGLSMSNAGVEAALFFNPNRTLKVSVELGQLAPDYRPKDRLDEVYFDRSPQLKLLQTQLSQMEIAGRDDSHDYQVIALGTKRYLVAGSPIQLSAESGTASSQRSYGYLFFVRELTPARLKQLERSSRVNFELLPLSSFEYLDIERTDKLFTVYKQNAETALLGYGIKVRGLRPLHQEIDVIFNWIVLNQASVLILAILTVSIGFSRLVIVPLTNLRRQVERIHFKKECRHEHLPDKGNNDDIDRLTAAFNGLLDDLDQQYQRRLFEATHDALTGLGNRTWLDKYLDDSLMRLRSGMGDNLILIKIDINSFKKINNIYGHHRADQLLKDLGAAIKSFIRRGDVVARSGDNEFSLVLVDSFLSVNNLNGISMRIMDYLQDQRIFADLTTGLSMCFAIVNIDRAQVTSEMSAADLVKKADITMHYLKQQGNHQNHTLVFNESMEDELKELAQLERDLAAAIQSNTEIEPWCQPLVSIDGKRVEGFELLGRWRHPVKGYISPVKFIPIAERTMMMRNYTHTFLRLASKSLQRLLAADSELRISINISVQELMHPTFVEDFHQILLGANLPINRINIELTESLLASNEQLLLAPMQRCRELGMHLHIDDFGTGYSSLARLHALPLHLVKIDKAFVDRIGHGGEPLLQAMINMAHGLKLPVICEGVETAQQLAVLRSLGADLIQGYYFAKPMSLTQALSWLEEHQEINH